MAEKQETSEDESFIILGTSPGTSLDLKCKGIDGPPLNRGALEDAIKDLSIEASSAFKAHFIDNRPSPESLMVASTMITEDKSIDELQKSFGEILDENIILKETLQKNNESMKEQFLLIASCQEDMMKTHIAHKEKFDQTRELVEKLRHENKKLKSEVAKLAEAESKAVGSSVSGQQESGPPSALEFVTSPDDDTINKLTAQLELVEKQRRQVIVDNEKLSWQKESLEHIVDATTKERDDLKEKLKNLELQLSNIENEHREKINLQNYTIQDLSAKLKTANDNMSSIPKEELTKRDEIIAKAFIDLKTAQLRILELENVKLEFSMFKSGVSDTIKLYKEQIVELQNRLKEVHATVFQPVRLTVNAEGDNAGSNSEYATFTANVKLYDKTLKHLGDFLNLLTRGSVDSLVECLGVIASLQDFKLDKSNVDTVKTSLAEMKQRLDKQHATALCNIGQVRNTLAILEGIFKDYKEVLKKCMERPEVAPSSAPPAANVEQLTAALVARGQEIAQLQGEITALKTAKEDTQLLRAQLDLYKSDFEAEREAREKMACEKENILVDLRTTQRRNQELMLQLEEVRKLNPNIFRSATSKKIDQNSTGPQSQGTGPSAGPTRPGTRRQSAPGTTTGNLVYTCPKCMRFSSDQYKVMEDHFDFCLDDF